MAETWYYVDEGKPAGPVSLDELKITLNKRPNWMAELVWRVGANDWVEAGTIAELSSAPAPPPLPKVDAKVILTESPTKTPTESRWTFKRLIVGAMVLVAVLFGAAIGGQIGRESIQYFMRPSEADQLATLRKGLNASLPKLKATLPRTVDETTTMVDVILDGLTLVYISVFDEERFHLSPTLDRHIRANAKVNVCKSDSTIPAMRLGARVRYVYQNKNGRILHTTELTLKDCI